MCIEKKAALCCVVSVNPDDDDAMGYDGGMDVDEIESIYTQPKLCVFNHLHFVVLINYIQRRFAYRSRFTFFSLFILILVEIFHIANILLTLTATRGNCFTVSLWPTRTVCLARIG